MKFAVLALAVVAAQEGADCSADATICDPDALACASWTDSASGEMMTCQDCAAEGRSATDSAGVAVMFTCPGDAAGGDEEGASSLFASVAAVLAVSSIMA